MTPLLRSGPGGGFLIVPGRESIGGLLNIRHITGAPRPKLWQDGCPCLESLVGKMTFLRGLSPGVSVMDYVFVPFRVVPICGFPNGNR